MRLSSHWYAVFAFIFVTLTSAASPIRAITDSLFETSVSIAASGKVVATILPQSTTTSPSTANPTATTTSSQGDPNPTIADVATGGGSYQVCHNVIGDFAPFCKPDNGSSVYTGEKYYVTWDTSYFGNQNISVYIIANYANYTNGGPVAFQSDSVEASTGFYVWTIDDAWRKGLTFNNVTLFMNPIDLESKSLTGPTVMMMKEPPTYYQQPPTKLPEGKALYIGLPTVFGFIVICLCGTYWYNRKVRQIGLGNIMGRKRGYGVRKSKRQRLGLGKKSNAIRLQQRELRDGDQYRDSPMELRDRPNNHATADSDLGSLAGSSPERMNYFREEPRRKEQRRY